MIVRTLLCLLLLIPLSYAGERYPREVARIELQGGVGTYGAMASFPATNPRWRLAIGFVDTDIENEAIDVDGEASVTLLLTEARVCLACFERFEFFVGPALGVSIHHDDRDFYKDARIVWGARGSFVWYPSRQHSIFLGLDALWTQQYWELEGRSGDPMRLQSEELNEATIMLTLGRTY